MHSWQEDEPSLYVSMLIRQSFAEGLGKRFVIYLGDQDRFDHHSTQSSITADYKRLNNEQRLSVYDLFREIETVKHDIDGLSIHISDPSRQADGLAELARLVKSIDLNIMLFSQPSFAELRSQATSNKAIRMLLFHTDDLVEQAYQPQLRCDQYAWQGSSNQALHLIGHSDQQARRIEFQEQKPSIELRIMPEYQGLAQKLTESSDHLSTVSPSFIFRNGWPHHAHINHKKLDPLQQKLNLQQLNGKQWIEDLLYREHPTISPQAHWSKDEVYWGQVLAVIKQRCLKWLIQSSMTTVRSKGVFSYPIITSDSTDQQKVEQVHPFDQDLYRLPLIFGSATQALFSGPKLWKAEIIKHGHLQSQIEKTGKESTIAKQSKSRRSEPKYKQRVCYGDWILIASLYHKLTRPKMMSWLCHELMEKKSLARSAVLGWLFDHSPVLALLEPRLGISYLKKALFYSDYFTDQNSRSFLRLVCPILQSNWTSSIHIERVKENYYSADTWMHLEAISDLNTLAFQSNFYALAEACIKTIGDVLRDVATQDYFMLSAPSMEALKAQRKRRMKIVQLAQVWQSKIKKAQMSIYGDQDYLESQILLSFANRWKESEQSLQPFLAYAEVILGSTES